MDKPRRILKVNETFEDAANRLYDTLESLKERHETVESDLEEPEVCKGCGFEFEE